MRASTTLTLWTTTPSPIRRVSLVAGKLDEAEAEFRRVFQIYRTIYNDKHYYIGIAESNLAGVHHERKQYAEAERLFRDVLRRYAEVLTPEHQLVGIAKVRYGETLLAAGKRADALRELQTADAIQAKQTSPPALWVERARKGLAAAKG